MNADISAPTPRAGAPRPGADHHARRPADDHPRRDRGEHRAAAYPERPALLLDQPVLGDERVHADVRRPAAAGRPGGRHPRPPPDVHRRPHHLHARLAGGRPRDHGRDAAGGPRHPGRRRRARLARRAGAGGQLLPRGQGAGQGARHLLGRGDRRQLARPGARRLYHRVALVALGAVHQRADRHRRHRDHPAVCQRDPPSARQVRPGRRDHLDRGHRRPRLRLHPGRLERLGRHRGHRLVRGRGRAAGALPVERDPRRAADHAAATIRR